MLEQYLDCEYGNNADSGFALSVFAVRDPIDRFASDVGEILHRAIDGCPGRDPCPALNRDARSSAVAIATCGPAPRVDLSRSTACRAALASRIALAAASSTAACCAARSSCRFFCARA